MNNQLAQGFQSTRPSSRRASATFSLTNWTQSTSPATKSLLTSGVIARNESMLLTLKDASTTVSNQWIGSSPDFWMITHSYLVFTILVAVLCVLVVFIIVAAVVLVLVVFRWQTNRPTGVTSQTKEQDLIISDFSSSSSSSGASKDSEVDALM